jgi:7,8-dihydropterin-6-yl-methyl-4-(beta-D-ribofuranosyl)aminobenzene 5'-phosphate synthase
MSESICITSLVENTVHQRGLKAEHGLAFHIQFGQYHVLFDTGQSDLLLHNARLLDLDLRQLDAIVLSHGHNDHCGGLKTALSLSPACRLHLHPAAVAAKFSTNAEGIARFIGMSDEAQKVVRTSAATIWTRELTEVVPGLFATGEISRQTSFEDVGGRFFLDERCEQPDALVDDQALFFESQDGLVVLLGCAHAGVVNTLEYIQHLTNGRPIHTVLGGMHLLTAGPERMAKTIEAFRRLKIQRIAPAHCTGTSAVAQMLAAFPDRCSTCDVGTRMTFRNQWPCSR